MNRDRGQPAGGEAAGMGAGLGGMGAGMGMPGTGVGGDGGLSALANSPALQRLREVSSCLTGSPPR